MPPKLAQLIAYCQASGIQGSYSAREDPPLWRARVKIGMTSFSAPADTRDEALERAAGSALRFLLDPMPQHGTPEYVAWEARKGR